MIVPAHDNASTLPDKNLAIKFFSLKKFTPPDIDAYVSHSMDAQRHAVSGIHLELRHGTPLWNALENASLSSLHIVCDTLTIHDELHLPGTHVCIYARRLVWKSEKAAINTQPKPIDGQAAGNGEKGGNAGALHLFIGEIIEESGASGGIRFKADGGRGQDGGKGANGNDGQDASFPTHSQASCWGQSGDWHYSTSIKFDPPAYYVYCQSNWGEKVLSANKIGTEFVQWCEDDHLKRNGKDGIAPGTPGDGGNGGSLKTNLLDVLKDHYSAKGGSPGTLAAPGQGGAAGKPGACGAYTVIFRFAKGIKEPAVTVSQASSVHSALPGRTLHGTPGKNGKAGKAAEAAGGAENAWLHPLNIRKALEYASDLFLCEQREKAWEFMGYYLKALTAPRPEGNGAFGAQDRIGWPGAIPGVDDGLWTYALNEMSSLVARLAGDLDYFGNRAGYTPLFSLQTAIKQCMTEQPEALRFFLLGKWMEAKLGGRYDRVEALKQAERQINEAIGAAEKQKESALARIDDLQKNINAALKEENDLLTLAEKRKHELEVEAKKNAELEALLGQIGGAVNIVGGLLQVLPIPGQPMIAGFSKAASLTLEKLPSLLDGNFGFEGGNGVLNSMSDFAQASVMRHVEKAKLEHDLREAAGEKLKDTNFASEAERTAAEDKLVEKGLALQKRFVDRPKAICQGISDISRGIQQAMRPASSVDQCLKILQNQDEEWKRISERLRNHYKNLQSLYEKFMNAMNELASSEASLAHNIDLKSALGEEKRKVWTGHDSCLNAFVKYVQDSSRASLIKSQYVLAKSYETTLLEETPPKSAPWWKIDALGESLLTFFSDGKTDKQSLGDLSANLETITPLVAYTGMAREIQDSLNRAPKMNSILLSVELGERPPSEEQVTTFNAPGNSTDSAHSATNLAARAEKSSLPPMPADILASLRETNKAIIDPATLNMVKRSWELARLAHVSLEEVVFSRSMDRGTSNVIISLRPADHGFVFKGDKVYFLYADSVPAWTWTLSAGNKFIQSSTPKDASGEELVKTLFGASDPFKTYAHPPLWSDLTLSLEATGISPNIPQLTYMRFSFEILFKYNPHAG